MNNIRLNTKLITCLDSILPGSKAEMVKATGIPNSTFYDLMKKPDEITIKQLLSIANGLHIPVRRFFTTGKGGAVGKQSDYVTEPYQPCRYDKDAIKGFIDSHRNATWKASGEATGMSWTGIQNSLLAVRRCPVLRFLTVCQRFSIDPFTILIDPNPEPKKSRRASSGGSDDALRAEIELMHRDIDTLRKDVDVLNNTVSDLTAKYESLLKAHEALLHRVQINIDTISGGSIHNIGIATDSIVSARKDD